METKNVRLAVGVKVVRLILLGVVVLITVKSGAPLNAQEQKAATATATDKSGDKKKTKIDFEDELIEGELKKPELFYLLQKKQFNFKRLIKLREDFMPEMRRDGNELRRGRGKN